jgi:GH15 family glucan-1,4-alpha-glucosidase
MDFAPIENYGVIGDLHTVALVGLDGSIDFMCFPRFDSPTVFAALLDPEKGGRFKLAPTLEGTRRKQLYLPDSNILLTRFLAQDGVAEVPDFMSLPLDPPRSAHRLGLPALAGTRLRHLGSPRRAFPISLFKSDVLGRH